VLVSFQTWWWWQWKWQWQWVGVAMLPNEMDVSCTNRINQQSTINQKEVSAEDCRRVAAA
jgi:hypothetical protein